ncbi:AAA domain-containing protein [Seinonella peptonophila]|uniref:AAA domain-containing protein n=1 Tax=Seinonella peptonophila TaxID=112248 RepID=A0A1M4WIQ0_9BACL|nr:AAA domain-containing protein [Seinonella peptonophila]SHE81129.1 AAA domain-containing protein [Seinonella peptonophila]
MNEIRVKVRQVFRYLLEVRKAWDKPYFHLNEYEHCWWQEELEGWAGIEWGERVEDAWMKVYRPESIHPLSIPDSLQDVVTNWQDPHESPTLMKGKEAQDHEFQEWVEMNWKPWAGKVNATKQTKQLYDSLFALYQRLDDESATIEIAFAHGLVQWKTEKQDISRHLFITPLEVMFDPEQGIFSLYQTSKGTYLDGAWLTHIDELEKTAIYEWMDQWEQDSFQPRNEFELKKHLSTVAQLLGEKSVLRPTYRALKELESSPILAFSPALIVRKKGHSLWQRELEKIIQQLENGLSIPSPLQQIVSEEILTPEKGSSLKQPLLFPLPANDQQKEIVTKLNQSSGVVVQGPPGTGKSHTIANLISHLLAQGKRVLVTSEKEQALRVLQEMIPSEIAALSVSLLGSDSQSLGQLDDSIRQIVENLETKEPKVIETKIDKWQKRLAEIQTEKKALKQQIVARSQLEEQPIGLTNPSMIPQEATKWLKDHKEQHWIPDVIPFQTEEPLNEQEKEQLVDGLNRFHPDVWKDYQQNRPKTADLLTPTAFERMIQEYEQATEEKQGKESLIHHWNINVPLSSSLDSAIKTTNEAIFKLRTFSSQRWKIMILKDIVAGGDRLHNWEEFLDDGRERLSVINDLQKNLMEYEIKLPIDRKHGLIREDLLTVLERMEENKNTGWMFQHLFGRKLGYIFKECFINDIPPRHEDDIRLLIDYIDWRDLLSRFVLRWNRMMEFVDGPFIEADNHRLFVEITEQLDEIEQLLNWNAEWVLPLHQWVQDLGVPSADWTHIDWFQQFSKGLYACKTYLKWKQVDQYYQQLVEKLTAGKESGGAHPVWGQLEEACLQKDVDKWRAAYQQIQEREQVQNDFEAFHVLLSKLKLICPQWVQQFVTERKEKDRVVWPTDWSDAWLAAQLRTWVDEYRALPSIDQMEEELLALETKELQITRHLVAEMAWQEMLSHITPEQKRSLISWFQNIKKIGKGTGKYADKYRSEASRDMKRCQEAIPVWIMPLHRVIETMELTEQRFDVVIVDESSQSNLFALCGLMRGEKVVIVGDDKQISPEAIGFDRQLNHELMERYLKGVPQMAQFEIMTSLYDLSSRVFTSKIMLKEHFRSVPDIIQFSNQQFYDNQLELLRVPTKDELFEEPLVSVHVTDGKRSSGTKMLNIPEAEAIVEKIVACCNDERYKHKTMGVISLMRSDQAKWIENQLRQRIGEAELLRRKLICGDPYRFQGDERDVIFLSLVVTEEGSRSVLNKETDRRRFNVAASRARDQLFLFHSISLSSLHPNCMRARLLQHVQDHRAVHAGIKEEIPYFDHSMIQEIYQWLDQRGYQVRTGTPYGDLIVEGGRARLAIHCLYEAWVNQGEWQNDWSKKRILKQMGWSFYHILAGDFHLNESEILTQLEQRIKELGIEPSEEKLSRNEYAQEFVATTTNYF